MNKPFRQVEHFWSELLRRKTVRTAVGYLILLFAFVGPASDILLGLGAPDWILRYVIIALLIGFPIVLVLSWLFDFTLHGFERTKGIDDLDEATSPEDEEEQPGDEEVNEILRLGSAHLNVPIDLAENRQVSVFSCSINALTDDHDDPELLIGFVKGFDSELDAIVNRYEGNRLNTGRNKITVAFGFPHTHEDDTRRAARTAIEILSLISEQHLNDNPNSKVIVRGGIHTDTIIVEEEAADHDAISLLGETASLAEYLNTIAPENTVVVSPQSQIILKQFFLLEEIQQINHPKFGTAQPVFTLGKMLTGQIQNIISQQSLIYGRENEQNLLLQQWNSVLEGETEFVLIKGEAGIGKSSLLTSTIKELLATEAPQLIILDCEPYFQASPLRPIISFLERAVYGSEHSLDGEARLQKLRDFLENLPIDKTRALPLLASLLSIDADSQDILIDDPGNILREKTLGFLVEFIHAVSEVQPVILIVEDLHWADSSTSKLIELIISDTPDHRILGIFTARPELNSSWVNIDHVREINLHKLNSRVTETMIREQAGSKKIPSAIVKQIVEESNGIPLYIEQLTEAFLESYVDFDESNYDKLNIPTSLKESLAARINNLGPSKSLLQLCAVLGFEFSYQLLKEVCETENEKLLRSVLEGLVNSGLLYRKGIYPRVVFRFRHRLIMEAASQLLLRKTRLKLHGVIAQTLESSFPNIRENRPTEIAHHYTEAGETEKAIFYWIKAARRSQLRFANDEVILLVDNGLRLLNKLTESENASNFEITLQKLRGEAYLVSKGYTNPEVLSAFERAVELAEQVEESLEIYQVVVGLWMHYVISGEYRRSLKLSQQLSSMARRIGDEPELLQADYCKGYTDYYMGDFDRAIKRLQSALTHDKPGFNYTKQNPSHDDTRIILNSILGLSYSAKGDSVTAEQHMSKSIELAREFKQPFGIIRALYLSSILHLLRGETSAAAEKAVEIMAISREKGFSLFIPLGMFISTISIQNDEKRLNGLIEPIEILLGMGARNGITYLLTILINECIEQSQWEKAGHYLNLNDKFISEQNELAYVSESYRLKALLHSRTDTSNDNSPALKLLDEGIEQALEIDNKPFALRCAITLAELSNKSDSSILKLKNILESFPVTDNTQDFELATEIVGRGKLPDQPRSHDKLN